MNEQEQRIAIAEACGTPTTRLNIYGEKVPRFTGDLPDYLHDLNAMREAEMLLDNSEWTIPGTIIRGSLSLFDAYTDELTKRFGRGLRATAAQRAEAFLRTIGKWRD